MMSELKTQRTDADVDAFLGAIETPQRQADCRQLVQLMQEVTGEAPAIWGTSIVGFGRYHYRYRSGREGAWFLTGFAPRKPNLTLYIMSGFDEYDGLMARLGKHTTGISCLYVKKLSDLDLDVLRELVARSVAHMRSVDVTPAA